MSEDENPKRQYNYSRAERVAIAKRTAQRKKDLKQAKALRAKKAKEARRLKAIEQAEQKAIDATIRSKTINQLTKQIDGTSPKPIGNIATEDQIEVAGTVFEEILEDDNAPEVVFKPNKGPQTDFLAASETEVLYGGSAGGGKSYGMLMDPLRYMHKAAARALLIRKSMPELMELLDLSKQLYPLAFPGAKFNKLESRWTFPSGATMLFGYCATDADVTRYVGQSYSWIGVDELTLFGTPYVWDTLRSRLRTTDLEIIPYMRATTNPGQIGGWWVKKMFVDPAPWGKPFWATDIETGKVLVHPDSKFLPDHLKHLADTPTFKRRFIPARLTDNPYLMESPAYMGMLSSLPETQRRRLLEGDWDVADSSAFPEFHKNIHTVPQFIPPREWPRFRACDYGYVAHTAVVWFAIDYDGTLYAYRELYQKGLDAEQLSEKIHEIEKDEPGGIIGILDNECWSRRGQLGPTIAQVMIDRGVRWNKADKGPGSRVNGKMEVHRLLAVDEVLGHPRVLISEACKNLIRVMPMLPVDPNNPEDVDTKYKEDHLYDAFRYGCTSKLIRAPRYALEMSFAHNQDYQPADATFGY